MTAIRALVLLGTVAWAGSACGPQIREAGRKHEGHEIVRIPKSDAMVTKGKKGQPAEGGEARAGDSGVIASHQAVWLARYVWDTVQDERDRDFRRLKAIEILFCPGDKADFTQCRVGVAYSVARERLGTAGID